MSGAARQPHPGPSAWRPCYPADEDLQEARWADRVATDHHVHARPRAFLERNNRADISGTVHLVGT